MDPITVNEENFSEKVLGAEKPVLLFFHADRCAFCHRTEPYFEELAAETDSTIFAKTDADKNPELVSRFGIMGLPAFILFDGGKEVMRNVGMKTRSQLAAMIQSESDSDLQFSR